MRGPRYLVAVFWLMGVVAASGMAAEYSPKDLLKFRPTQTGVNFDTPADAAAIDACKVELVTDAQKRTIGFALRDGQGKLLRRFVITSGGKYLNQWSYYQDGFEVYREVNLDGDRSLDECRWLNAGGTRVATVKAGKIVGWKRLSAEEASKVLVQALVSSDITLLDSLMATPEELAGAGLPKEVVDKVSAGADKRELAVETLRKTLAGWTARTVWNRFDGTFPHVIPADQATGLSKDLVLYENAVVFAGAPASQASAAKDLVPADSRDDQAGRDLEARGAAPRRGSGKAGRRLRQWHSRGDLRHARLGPPARRGDGDGPQGPGRL